MISKDEVIEIARETKMQVVFDSKFGREEYQSVCGSFPAFERFANACYKRGIEDAATIFDGYESISNVIRKLGETK